MLLTMMDGAEGLSGVYVLAATSRPDLIDPALLRPGRLDKSLICDMPSEEDRLDILRAISGKLRIDGALLNAKGSQSLAGIARQTEGYSGADLQAILYNAHLEAIHDLLGATEGSAQELGKQRKGASSNRGASKHQDFTYFRLGAGQDKSNNEPQPAAAIATERAQIAATLANMQLARRKARQERHAGYGQRPGSASGGSLQSANGPSNINGQSQDHEPVIVWRHLQKSVDTTRSSISAQDRRRLAAIYREFVVGRNGEMSDGQGSSEIGGRTSLM